MVYVMMVICLIACVFLAYVVRDQQMRVSRAEEIIVLYQEYFRDVRGLIEHNHYRLDKVEGNMITIMEWHDEVEPEMTKWLKSTVVER